MLRPFAWNYGVVKKLKWYKINVVVVGLTIWMHFQQFEDFKFLIFYEGIRSWTSLKPLQSVQLSRRFRRDCLDSTWESRIPVWLQSGHGEYPDFEDQPSQANEQRNNFLLNYHNICYKMNKPFNLDIQVNSAELQSCWMTQELQNKITWQCWLVRYKGFLAFQHF